MDDTFLRIKNLRYTRKHSFLDYVFGGCMIQLQVAIDFTLSNYEPS